MSMWISFRVKLPEEMIFTSNLQEAIEDKEYLILAVPSVFTRSTAKSMAPFCKEGQVIVCVAKGIEENTLMTLSDIVEKRFQLLMWLLCAPSHAEEVMACRLLVAGAAKKRVAEGVQDIFMNEVFRATPVRMCWAWSLEVLLRMSSLLQQVWRMVLVMETIRRQLITRGITEMGRFALKMGAKYETLSGLTGIGDLIVTCESKHSRNRKAGMLIGQGYPMQQALDEVKMVVEGVYSAKAAIALAKKYDVDMPIIEAVNRVLFEDMSVKDAVAELMMRDKRAEYGALEWSE